MKLKPKILTYKENLREVEYPWYLEVLKYTWQSPWTYTEVAMTGDIQDWKEITEREREVIAGILRGFTLIENHIGCYWRDIVAKTFGHPEIRDLAVTFSHTEGIHRRAYDHLEATLGFNTYEAFLADPVTRKKLDYFINNLESPSDLGRSLALFSAAGEGVSLFSSFGVLLAFSQDSRFKGMWQIISWSAIDEWCLTGDTEYLTPEGWKPISQYKQGDLVAQYDMQTKEVSFVKPLKYIEKETNQLISISKRQRFSQVVTPNHRVLDYKEGTKEVREAEAKDWSPRQSYMPVSGFLQKARQLTPLDQFSIALQADGWVRSDLRSKREVGFYFKRERKVERFRELAAVLVSEYGFDVKEYDKTNTKKGGYKFRVLIPDEYLYLRTKSLQDVFSFDNIPQGFIEELQHWDGSKPQGYETDAIVYSCAVLENVEFVQTIASLQGYYSHIYPNIKKLKDGREFTCYKLYMKKETEVYARHSKKEEIDLNGDSVPVYCFSVPTGAFLVRHNGLISVTGNCHSRTGIQLYKDLVSEDSAYKFKDSEVYEGFEAVVQNEINYINQIFSNGDLSYVTRSETEDYIKYRANLKLMELYLKPIYELSGEYRHMNHYFKTALEGKSLNDFFAQQRNGGAYTAKLTQDFRSCTIK